MVCFVDRSDMHTKKSNTLLDIDTVDESKAERDGLRRRFGASPAESTRAERVADLTSSLFVMGNEPIKRNKTCISHDTPRKSADPQGMLALSRQVTLGRNSEFLNLTKEDREKLGGIEYRSLKLLLKIVFCEYWPSEHYQAFDCMELTNSVSILLWSSYLWSNLSCGMDSVRRSKVRGLPKRMWSKHELVVSNIFYQRSKAHRLM